MSRIKNIIILFIMLSFGNIRAQKDSLLAKVKHPSGTTFTKEECRIRFEHIIKGIDLRKGEMFADVGAGSGNMDVEMSVLTDSVSFYIEDIDRRYLAEDQLKVLVNYYSVVKGSIQTNSFQYVLGTNRTTKLPDTFFDKIMVYNAFHEFTYVDDMINDLFLKLKPNGKLIIKESLSAKEKFHFIEGCNITAYQQTEIIELMNIHGLFLTGLLYPENNEENIFIFEKDQHRSEAYLLKKKNIDNYLKTVNLLDSAFIKGDSLKIDAVSDALVLKRSELLEVYPSVELWFNDLGYEFYNKKNYTSAIHLFKMNVRLFPNSYNVYDSLGDAYLNNNQKELALINFTKALELYPENVAEKEKLEKLKKEMQQ